MGIRVFVVRHWKRLSRWQKRLAVIVSIIGSVGAILAAIAVVLNFLADPPDFARSYLDRYVPGLVDSMQGMVCWFKAGKHSISTGPLASCDTGSLGRLVSDSCVSFEFVPEDRPDDADDPTTKIQREAVKSRLEATRVCQTWPKGTNVAVSASADKILEALAKEIPDCFSTGVSAQGKPVFWLRTSSPSVCAARVTMGRNREWQVVKDPTTFFCLDRVSGAASPRDLPRDCTLEEAKRLGLPSPAAP